MEHLINKHVPKGSARRQKKERVQDSTRRGSGPQDGVASFNRTFLYWREERKGVLGREKKL